jgi:hypothetical protein
VLMFGNRESVLDSVWPVCPDSDIAAVTFVTSSKYATLQYKICVSVGLFLIRVDAVNRSS